MRLKTILDLSRVKMSLLLETRSVGLRQKLKSKLSSEHVP